MHRILKKALCIFSASVLTAAAIVPAMGLDTAFDPGDELVDLLDHQLGDVNGDGRVAAADARLALQASARIVTLTEIQKLAADYDADGKVSAADARYILRAAAKLDPFAPPTTVPPTTEAPSTVPVTGSSRPDYNILEDDQIQYLGDPSVIVIDQDRWYLTLVNTHYAISADTYIDLAEAVPGSGEYLDSRVAAAYQQMYYAAANDGLYLWPCSGYRSYQLQANNYQNKTQLYQSYGYGLAEAKAKAAMIIMPPGCSEHNLGLAMDIIATDDYFYTTAEYAWLMQNAADYGFILRYPKDKQHITRVEYEPWHWRYVGVEYAHLIKDSGLCLEEFLEAYGPMPQVR